MKKGIVNKLTTSSIIFFVLAMIFLLPYMSSLGEELPASIDTNFFYSMYELKNLILLFNDSHIETYINIRWSYDVIWPVIYTFFFVMMNIRLNIIRKKKLINLFTIIALLPFIFDIMENILITLILSFKNARINLIFLLASFSSALKWLSIAIVFIILLFRGLRNIVPNSKNKVT